MKIGIAGAGGRMGRMNITQVVESEMAIFAAALESKNSPFIGKNAYEIAGFGSSANFVEITDDIDEFISDVDGVIDFTTPNSTLEIAKKCAEKNLVHVIGTTGIDKDKESQLKEFSKNARIVYAPNMSVGVNMLFALVEKAAKILDDSYDIEIVEMHHNKKVDSPSGTALGLGKAVAKGRNVNLEDVWCKERDGNIGARKKGEIGFATLRGGDVVGDHTVIFATEGERVEITHKASGRNIFSKGALRACLWAKNQPSGLYSMLDVLGF
ncbi:MAG: 4-hydroxy-tetrahydrodipicolinate reductase [Rickettsiales bacterium]|nr:4-hydroxy-tetrahydrodipicolinate reductase [Rickettsiales bacterium]